MRRWQCCQKPQSYTQIPRMCSSKLSSTTYALANVRALNRSVRRSTALASGLTLSRTQISMRLSKIGQDDKYIWWSVVSILMQVRDPKNPANALLLSLAERQVYAHYASIATARGIDTNLVANDASAGEHQKGKSREVSSVGVASPAGSENQPATLEFDSAHDFHVVTRLLELRALQTSPNGDAGIAASTDITLPSVASSSASSLSPQQLLLAHLTSQQGDKWCESSLGLEIWRREIELRHGSLEGGEWKASWERLKGMLDKG